MKRLLVRIIRCPRIRQRLIALARSRPELLNVIPGINPLFAIPTSAAQVASDPYRHGELPRPQGNEILVSPLVADPEDVS
jgi:hypothetical protein